LKKTEGKEPSADEISSVLTQLETAPDTEVAVRAWLDSIPAARAEVRGTVPSELTKLVRGDFYLSPQVSGLLNRMLISAVIGLFFIGIHFWLAVGVAALILLATGGVVLALEIFIKFILYLYRANKARSLAINNNLSDISGLLKALESLRPWYGISYSEVNYQVFEGPRHYFFSSLRPYALLALPNLLRVALDKKAAIEDKDEPLAWYSTSIRSDIIRFFVSDVITQLPNSGKFPNITDADLVGFFNLLMSSEAWQPIQFMPSKLDVFNRILENLPPGNNHARSTILVEALKFPLANIRSAAALELKKINWRPTDEQQKVQFQEALKVSSGSVRSEVRSAEDEAREDTELEFRAAAARGKWKTMPPMPPVGQIQALEELLRPDRDDLGEMQAWIGHLVRVLEETPPSLKLFLFARDWDSPTSKEEGMTAKEFMLAAMRNAKTVDGRRVDLLKEFGDRVVVFTRSGSFEKPYDYQAIMRWLKTGKHTLEGNISEDIADPAKRAAFEREWGADKKWAMWEGHNARKGIKPEPELDENGLPKKDEKNNTVNKKDENGNEVYPLERIPLIDGVLDNRTGEAVSLDGTKPLPPLVQSLRNTELGKSSVEHLLVFDAEIGMTGEDVFWTFAKMNDPRNKRHGMFEPRQIVRNEAETVQTFNEATAGGSLWFTHGALSRFFNRIRAFGKFGIKVNKYYDDIMEPTVDDPYGPYIGASVRASDMILHPTAFKLTKFFLFIVVPVAVTLCVNAVIGLGVFLAAFSLLPRFFAKWPHVKNSGTSRALLSHDEWEAVFTPVALMNDIVMEDDAKPKPINWLERLYRWIGTFDANSILARARNAHIFRQSSRVFNNVIIRGLFATAIWLVLILVGGAETSVPGLGGVSRPLLGEFLYAATMIALLHTKITGPLMNYLKKLGWGWGSVVAVIMGAAVWKFQLDALFFMVAFSGLVALVAIFLPHGWGTNLYFHIGERELSGTVRLKGDIKQTKLKTALSAPLQMGDIINQGGEETVASTGFLLNYLDYSVRYIRKAFSSVFSMLKTKRVTALAQPKIPKETIFDAIRALRRTVTVGLVLLFGMWGSGWMTDAGLGALQVGQGGQLWIAIGFAVVFLGNYVHIFSKWVSNKAKLADATENLENEKIKEKELDELAASNAEANGTTVEEEKAKLRREGKGANLSRAADFQAEIDDAKHALRLNRWDIGKTLFHPLVLFAAVLLAPYYGPLLDQHLLGRALPIHLALIGGPFIAFFLGFEFHKTKLLKYFA